MKGDKELRQWQGGAAEGKPAGGRGRPVTVRGKMGLICLRPGGAMWGEEKRLGEARLLESSSHPAAGR